MEVCGRVIRKTEPVSNSSNPFQTRRCLDGTMGEQDMLVLMPHGNWRWAPFSQLANQLTFCRRKTTVRTLPGFPISPRQTSDRLSHGRVSREPCLPAPPPVDKAVGLASRRVVTTPPPLTIIRQRRGSSPQTKTLPHPGSS